MAIAFAQVKYLSRSKALQATAAAAYRSCSRIYDERTGIIFDYTKKKSPLLYSEILLPENTHPKFQNREFLWNAVEKTEVRRNSQVAKEIVLALPKDEAITEEDKIELAKQFAIIHFVNKDVAVDINIHDEIGNPHVHLLITTRRLEGDRFASHKARHLDPKVIKGRVQVDKVWGDEWRQFQNQYFLAKGLDLTVDANGICSQVHLGKHVFHAKNRNEYDLWQINQGRHQEAKQIALTDAARVLNQLTLHHSVFTERDIACLLHKHIDNPNEFQIALLQVKTSKKLMSLGLGDDGKERYTTRAMFVLENQLQDLTDELRHRYCHPVNRRLDKRMIEQYRLNEEQAQVATHILQGSDLTIVVGRAGTGKTYTLKAVQTALVESGYQVHGITLSGVAAQNLQEQSHIPSRTIASFCYAVAKETLKLTDRDVIIMDEAGMTDAYSFAEVLDTVHKAHAKLILVGDDAQLQPIGPGAPFRALLERTGFAELQDIVRQSEIWQRQATHQFATGKTNEALASYQDHRHIHFSKTAKDAMHKLVNDWHAMRTQDEVALPQALILAHRKLDAIELNHIARAKRILSEEINQGILFKRDEGEIWLSQKDRILFLKNDSTLEVRNGQFATVTKIETNSAGEINSLIVDLDNTKQVRFNPEIYPHFTYGYAATIHKAQGTTTNHSLVYVGDRYWDRNLMYVAASRHRKSLDIYVDQMTYPDFEALVKGVDRNGTTDNVIDFPLNFAKRRGLENENLFEKFKQHALECLKSARKFLQEKYQQLIGHCRYEKTTTIVKDRNHDQSKPSVFKQHSKSDPEIEKIQTNLQKLHGDLIHAKEQKNQYVAYRLKKQLQQEFNFIYKNKKLSQAMQMKSPQLFKELQHTLKNQYECEIE